MAKDLIYLLELGLSLEEIARRAGRTPRAIEHEINTYLSHQEGGHDRKTE